MACYLEAVLERDGKAVEGSEGDVGMEVALVVEGTGSGDGGGEEDLC